MADPQSSAQEEAVKPRWKTHAFVLFAAGVVALAFGTALKVQLDLPVWFSSVFGILIFMAGSLGHLAVVRGQKISELEAKSADMRHSLDRLTAPVARYRRGMPDAAPGLPKTPGETAAAAAALAPDEQNQPSQPDSPEAAPATRKHRWSRGTSAARAAPDATQAAAKDVADTAKPPAALTSGGQADLDRDAAEPFVDAAPAPPTATTPVAGRAADAAAIQGFVERLSRDTPQTSTKPTNPAEPENVDPFGVDAFGADESPDTSATPAVGQDEAAISQSVRALRETAATMREATAAPARNAAPANAQGHAEPAVEPGLAGTAFGQAEDELDADSAFDDAAPIEPRPVDPRLGTLVSAMRNDGIEVYLEPIVGLSEKTPRHFEVSARFRDEAGNAIDPHVDPYGLRGTGILPLLDLAKIGRVADVARRLAERGKTGSIFTNLATETFEDDDFLNRFAEIYTDRMAFAEQLVVTLAQDEARMLSGTQLEMVDDMRDLGFRFALDHVTSLDMDFEVLRTAGVAFIKLDAAIFLEGLPTGDDAVVPAEDICRWLGDLGFEVIVEDIADDAALERLVDCGVQLGRGDVFGGARPVKAEVFAPRPSAAA